MQGLVNSSAGFQSLCLGLAHHGCKVRKTVLEPWKVYLPDTERKSAWMKDFRALPHFNVVIVLSFTGFSFKLNHSGAAKGTSLPTRVGTEAAGAWDLADYLCSFDHFCVDLVENAWDCCIFEKMTLKVRSYQITIPVLLVTDVEFARCASCRSTSVGHFCRLLLWACQPKEELKQLKEQKELQQDHASSQGRGVSDAISKTLGTLRFGLEWANTIQA